MPGHLGVLPWVHVSGFSLGRVRVQLWCIAYPGLSINFLPSVTQGGYSPVFWLWLFCLPCFSVRLGALSVGQDGLSQDTRDTWGKKMATLSVSQQGPMMCTTVHGLFSRALRGSPALLSHVTTASASKLGAVYSIWTAGFPSPESG